MNSRVADHPQPRLSTMPGEPHRTLLDALKHNAACAPDAMVYKFIGHESDEDEVVSNAALAALVSRYARAIGHLARTPARVVLVLPQGKHFVAAYFGCIAARATALATTPISRGSKGLGIR